MKSRSEDGLGKAGDEPGPSKAQASTPLWLLVIPAAISAVVFTNSWLSGSGSWPDWLYVLLISGSLALIVTVVVQRRRAQTKR